MKSTYSGDRARREVEPTNRFRGKTCRHSGLGIATFDSGFAFSLFFISGVAALIYEISWSRQIGLFFGHTVHAAAVVLGSYFGGMAVGCAVGGRYASRFSPLAAYGIAELVVAIWACLIPSILSLTESTPLVLWLANSSPAVQTALRGLYCFLLLLPATTALGATLPFIAEFLSPAGRTTVDRVSMAYAVNTSGAFVGVVCATLFLLVTVGVRGSSYLAAGLSTISGGVAFGWARRRSSDPNHDHRLSDKADVDHIPKLSKVAHTASQSAEASNCIWWSMITGLCGFAALALEVLYTRLFSLVFHNSTYTFGTVVAVFLASLALGAAIAPLLSRRFVGEKLLGAIAWLGSVMIVISVIVFIRVTGLEYFKSGESFAGYLMGALTLVMVVVLPPVTLLGILLPVIWKSIRQNTGTGDLVGRLTMVNTLAAATGSFCASFVLLPTFGLWASFGIVAMLCCMISAAALMRLRRYRLALLGGLTSLPLLFLMGGGAIRWTRPASMSDEDLVRRWESAYGWIDVVHDRNEGVMKLRQNLHYRHGATGNNAIRERRQATIPLLLHEQPQDVLFLGLGTGVSASGALAFDDVERIDIVELIPNVVKASRFLGEFNDHVVNQPRVHIAIDDARHFLMASDSQYDLIVSDLFVPWESHTGYLYTVEHYRVARDRLNAGGLYCQWLPLYQMGAQEFEMIADSFASVFPVTNLWWGRLESQGAVLALIGSIKPDRVNAAIVQRRFNEYQEHTPKPDSYLRRPTQLMDLYLGQWPVQAPSHFNTDEHPRVEFLTPHSQRNRNLLTGMVLRQYFDTIFVRLPNGESTPVMQQQNTNAELKRRRAVQRLILFGE